MIAIVVLINLLSHINCQQIQSWPSSYPIPSLFGLNNAPSCLQNKPNYQSYQDYLSQSSTPLSPLNPETNIPSLSSAFTSPDTSFAFGELSSSFSHAPGSQTSITPNLSEKISKLLSEIPKPTSSMPKISLPDEPTTYTSLQYSPTSQITQAQYLSLTPTTTSLGRSTAATDIVAPSPVIPSSLKTPRSIIPSPLTESIPQYPYDPFRNTFELPEPKLSSVGCLALTMTPYGTISETPLLDPSVSLPRSPYLPVSSPVSALAPPLSPLLPPMSPAAGSSTFLRKVAVPPPFV